MLTTDLSLRFDPIYAEISMRFFRDPKAFRTAFTNAWLKLTHRDMGPISNYAGPEIPKETFIWQDPIPEANFTIINDQDIAGLKITLLQSGLTISQLVSTAWASASTFRNSDRKGGANGARIRLAPQKDWEVNNPAQLEKILTKLAEIQTQFNAKSANTKVSIADLIVLGGSAAIEKSAKDAGYTIQMPFSPGRTDAEQAQTDIEFMHFLEPIADGFRNYQKKQYTVSTEALLVDKAQLLTLSVPEMTVLVGGMRMLDANFNHTKHGVFTERPGLLSNDFFVNLLDMRTQWKATTEIKDVFQGSDRTTGKTKWTATRADLIFGSNSELRALTEVYGSNDGEELFIHALQSMDESDESR